MLHEKWCDFFITALSGHFSRDIYSFPKLSKSSNNVVSYSLFLVWPNTCTFKKRHPVRVCTLPTGACSCYGERPSELLTSRRSDSREHGKSASYIRNAHLSHQLRIRSYKDVKGLTAQASKLFLWKASWASFPRLSGPHSLSQLLNYPLSWKQSQTVQKWMTVTVFQENCI